jgi:simple sugar transport system substrate-binding protein
VVIRALMRPLFVLAFLSLLVPTLAAAQGVDVKVVGMVTPSSKTNLGWDQQGADGLTKVADELHIKAEIQENAGYDDITPILKDLKDSGAQLIICHASGYQTTCPEFAAEEQVPVAVIENPKAVVPNLVSDIETQAQEVAYLAGVLAGRTTKTQTVGIVVSGEPPTWNYMTVGFAEGLKASNGSAKLLYSVIGEDAYEDSAGAKRVTEQQLAAGADIIFGMGDGASFGMIEAIRDFNKDHKDAPARFIDVIGDKSKDYSDVLLTSVLFDYAPTYKQMIEDLKSNTFGKVYTLDVKNGGVKLLDLPDDVPQDVKDAVTKAQDDIVAGKIKVPAIGDADGVRKTLAELGYR